MERKRAYEIINALAEGVNPLTGEILPDDHLCNTGDVLRALQCAASSLNNKKQNFPENAGKPWSKDEEERLKELYNSGLSKKDISKELSRTTGSISSRLNRLGLIND